MTLKLSQSDIQSFLGPQSGSGVAENVEQLNLGPSIWSVTEKKYTRYLRKKHEKPTSADPRIIEIPKQHVGALFGKNRERLKRLEMYYGMSCEEIPNQPSSIDGSINNQVVTMKINLLNRMPMNSSSNNNGSNQGSSNFNLTPEAEHDLYLIRQDFEFVDGLTLTLCSNDEYNYLSQHRGLLSLIAKMTKTQISLDKNDSDNNNKQNSVTLRGPKPQISKALECLEQHLLYLPISKELEYLEGELEGAKNRLQRQMGA